ncbi:hypothetical protein LguiA_021070 [Lonicera macranthoides]
MGYFDLNIPYYESDKQITDKSTKKTNRLKLLIKSMELGYNGVAYNRTMKGVMSESERCDISLFPLSSILKLAPSISSAVELHRNLLGVPLSTPFRQYTRLTVVVDSPAQASALNSGNPILKSYDIVAVRPLNQNAFEQACQTSEVDLIAIDFSEKLPFRLKQSIVKAAIERGVYFEITYSSLIMDAQVRRQMITNAKLLVDWTRGKSLVISSAAPSVTELRGPNDIANLSSLLGLSMERAKAAISKNCRSLVTNALKKKYFYKEAIRVEVIPSEKQFDSMGSGFDDWLKWDPISSGEGDLQLDDIEKAFNASNKTSNTVKAIDFASVLDSLPPNGLQIKDLISSTNLGSEPPDIGKNLSTVKEPQVPALGYGVSESPERLKILKKDTKFFISSTEKGLTNSEEIGDCTPTIDEESNILNGFDVETEAQDLESQICRTNCEMDLMIQDNNATVPTLVQDTEIAQVSMQSKNIDSSAFNPEESNRLKTLNLLCEHNIGTDKDAIDDNATVRVMVKDTEIGSTCNVIGATEIFAPCSDVVMENEESKRDCLDVVLGAENDAVDEVLLETEMKGKLDASLASRDLSLHEDFPKLPVLDSVGAMKSKTDSSIPKNVTLKEVAMENKMRIDSDTVTKCATSRASLSGKGRVKRRTSHGPSLFPFKRLLSPIPMKKKAWRVKRKL